MGIDFKRAFTFYREDPDWLRKLALGGVLGLIPILGWATLVGVGVEVFRNVAKERQDSVLPDFSEFGPVFFRGLSASAGLLCHALVFGLLYLVVSLPLAFLIFGSGLGGHHAGGRFWIGLVGLLVYLAFNGAAWMALALYAENLEVASCFRLLDLAERVSSTGKGYLLVVLAWTLGSSALAGLSSLIPGTLLSLLVVSFLGFPLFLSCVHALAQALESAGRVELSDPLDWASPVVSDSRAQEVARPAPSESRRVPPGRQARPQGPKASALVESPPETVLTWSTDSDRPDPR